MKKISAMNNINEKKYMGYGGNEQRIFIKDARIGWRTLLNDPTKHLSSGITQNEYLEFEEIRLGGQAIRLLDNLIERWDYRDETNYYYEEATTREARRSMWRIFYKSKAVFDLRQVQLATIGRPLVLPDQSNDPIEEPAELDEFLTTISFSGLP